MVILPCHLATQVLERPEVGEITNDVCQIRRIEPRLTSALSRRDVPPKREADTSARRCSKKFAGWLTEFAGSSLVPDLTVATVVPGGSVSAARAQPGSHPGSMPVGPWVAVGAW